MDKDNGNLIPFSRLKTSMGARAFFKWLLCDAVNQRASDIHVIGNQIFYRIDKLLKPVSIQGTPSEIEKILEEVISIAKQRTRRMDSTNKLIAQDGSFEEEIENLKINFFKKYFFRVSTLPVKNGETLDLRVLPQDLYKSGFKQLGMSPQMIDFVNNLKKLALTGLIIMSGPTGSGKSTTLKAILHEILKDSGLLGISIEDPIEIFDELLIQTEVNYAKGMDFPTLLSKILRHDPDIIHVGEIRDKDTAELALAAAHTGHLVPTTIHTIDDCASAITRLTQTLQVEPYHLATVLRALMAQRLVRQICPKCKIVVAPNEKIWPLFFNRYPEEIKFYMGSGRLEDQPCPSCQGTGYRSMTSICEVMEIDPNIRQAIIEKRDPKEIMALAKEKGMQTMQEDGLRKLRWTTMEELLRTLPYISPIDPEKVRLKPKN